MANAILQLTDGGADFSFECMGKRTWEGTAFGGARGRTDVPRIADGYMAGKTHIDSLITRTLPLDDINRGVDLMKRGETIRSVELFRVRDT